MLKSRQKKSSAPPPGEWLPGRRGFRIFVPGRLVNPLGSVSSNRMTEHRRREQWKNGVAGALLAIGYRRGDFDPATRKKIAMTLHVAKRFDGLNLMGAVLKPIPDALTQFGVINDDRDSAQHEWVEPIQIIDRACPGVSVEVQLL